MITAIEASGKNKDENYVWDSSDFEGYVKGKILAGCSFPPTCTKGVATLEPTTGALLLQLSCEEEPGISRCQPRRRVCRAQLSFGMKP